MAPARKAFKCKLCEEIDIKNFYLDCKCLCKKCKITTNNFYRLKLKTYGNNNLETEKKQIDNPNICKEILNKNKEKNLPSKRNKIDGEVLKSSITILNSEILNIKGQIINIKNENIELKNKLDAFIGIDTVQRVPTKSAYTKRIPSLMISSRGICLLGSSTNVDLYSDRLQKDPVEILINNKDEENKYDENKDFDYINDLYLNFY